MGEGLDRLVEKMNGLHKISKFIKNEVVLTIAFVLAVLSEIYVGSNLKESAGYLDFRVLALLFCLMGVMAGIKELGIFNQMAEALLSRVHTVRGIAAVLVFLCFFLAMFITNDVALITFVPFGIMMLDMTDNRRYMVYIIVLQTIAANLGSMLMPIGNPQNLYLYSLSKMKYGEFVRFMLPYTAAAFILLVIALIFVRGEKIDRAMVRSVANDRKAEKGIIKRLQLLAYAVMFVLCILCVAHILNYKIIFTLCFVGMLVFDRKNLKRIDYCLLMTFVCFFIFVGNVGKLDSVKEGLFNLIKGREVVVSFLTSQVISNVPAATLLSGFTDNIEGLIIGTNIGGLGTIIASLASLISFKYFAQAKGNKGSYMLLFTALNIIFAAALLLLYSII